MSYTMGSLDCIAITINQDYVDALVKDIEAFKEGKLVVTGRQLDILQYYLSEDIESLSDLVYVEDDFHHYDSGKYSENFALATKIDLNTGKFLNDTQDNFEGYVYEFSYGSPNIYKPDFQSKEDFISQLKEELYIPTTFDVENNVIFLTGVWGG